MKLTHLVVVLGLAYSVVAQSPPKDLEELGKIPNGASYAVECLKDSGLQLDSLKSLHTGDFSKGEDVKCIVKCFYQRAGFMDAEGNLNGEAILAQLRQLLPEDRVKALVENCNVQGKDACDTAYLATECYFRNKAF
ncbi:general odorant-binding protein 56d-like [Toxorhynchites rutilus septentrionalis]|uniref:general odorant-binding protein 56d-like n=1 Tax=Toxorhynchites rutilus septentrionalis TaxID=329112 RepID=UPI002478B6C9|nr:general odorant-binding protein 56d-like [Toxorhynchites rutilus septentrionalis]